MDTRQKIVSANQLRELAAAGHKLAAGFFDVLTAAQVARLDEIAAGGKVAVAVLPKDGALLSARARVELAAALACVSAAAEWDGSDLPPGAVPLAAEHEQASAALIERVLDRHAG